MSPRELYERARTAALTYCSSYGYDHRSNELIKDIINQFAENESQRSIALEHVEKL